jgi:hypothetical protein
MPPARGMPRGVDAATPMFQGPRRSCASAGLVLGRRLRSRHEGPSCQQRALLALPMAAPTVSLVIPAYNEEWRPSRLLDVLEDELPETLSPPVSGSWRPSQWTTAASMEPRNQCATGHAMGMRVAEVPISCEEQGHSRLSAWSTGQSSVWDTRT